MVVVSTHSIDYKVVSVYLIHDKIIIIINLIKTAVLYLKSDHGDLN